MSAYYNEIDAFAAAWLRELIKAGQIADGEVDERSIEDVRPDDLRGFTQCHFFAGIGGWSYALRLAGWPDDRPVWTGSCPCQPFSAAGKRKGTADERHLWPAWFHLIAELRPDTIFGEQVKGAIKHGWLDLVQDDMEAVGYAFGSGCLPAASIGACHNRLRLWFVAHSERGKQSWEKPRCGKTGRMGREPQSFPWNESLPSALCRFRALDDGLSYGMAATDATRNAIVPQVAAEFIMAYMRVATPGEPAQVKEKP